MDSHLVIRIRRLCLRRFDLQPQQASVKRRQFMIGHLEGPIGGCNAGQDQLVFDLPPCRIRSTRTAVEPTHANMDIAVNAITGPSFPKPSTETKRQATLSISEFIIQTSPQPELTT